MIPDLMLKQSVVKIKCLITCHMSVFISRILSHVKNISDKCMHILHASLCRSIMFQSFLCMHASFLVALRHVTTRSKPYRSPQSLRRAVKTKLFRSFLCMHTSLHDCRMHLFVNACSACIHSLEGLNQKRLNL